MNQVSPLLTVMVNAARKAGRSLVRDFGELEHLQVSRKGVSDFVTNADTKAEKILREELTKGRPKFGLLMEESGETVGSDTSNRWLVDPLDGTTNFMHGIAHFAVSIALERDGTPYAGVVYNPITDELFCAEHGKGARLMGTGREMRLRVSARSKLDEAVITTGIPHKGRGSAKDYLPALEQVMNATAGIRRLGSAALDLAFVAAGRCDGYWETGLQPWDTGAGVVLVREAGGLVSAIDGKSDPVATGSIVAANAALHGPLRALVAVP